jgi:hypothetical protein
VNYVEVSIDGASPAVHYEFRGIPGTFERAIQGVKNCVESKLGLALFFLAKVCCPLKLAGISFKFQRAFSTFA